MSDDGHFIDDPVAVVGVKPDFSGMGLSKKIENAIIIGGKVYELIDDSEENECDRCDLKICQIGEESICVMLFDDVIGKRFKERTDLRQIERLSTAGLKDSTDYSDHDPVDDL